MPTLSPCLQDQKALSAEALLALLGLAVLHMSQGDLVGGPSTGRGQDAPELTAGAEAERTSGAFPRRLALGSREASAKRPMFRLF